eukprot:SAG11_NODE_18464_length_490_cov_1.053708_1_plen_50_part_10
MQPGIEPSGGISLRDTPSLLSDNLAVRSDGGAFVYAHRSNICVATNSTAA